MRVTGRRQGILNYGLHAYVNNGFICFCSCFDWFGFVCYGMVRFGVYEFYDGYEMDGKQQIVWI